MSIDDYLKQNPRHKLVFTQNEPDGFVLTNLGFEMVDKLDGQTLPSVVATGAFESVVTEAMQVHPKYRKCHSGQFLTKSYYLWFVLMAAIMWE